MRKTVLSFFIVVFTALALPAGKFWEDKPYQEWTQAEVRTIITHSPWSQSVQVGGGPRGFDWGGLSRPEAGAGRAPTVTSQSNEPPRRGSVGDESEGARSSRPGTFHYYVIWSSAKTVRQALARNQVLQGMTTAEQVKQGLQQPVTNYTITIIGADLSAFGQVHPDELKAHTYLRAGKRKKTKVQPEDIQIVRADPEERVASVTFVFPRELPAGEPLLLPNEKKVEFHCEVKKPKIKIKTSFELKRMKVGKELDL